MFFKFIFISYNELRVFNFKKDYEMQIIEID